MKKLFGPLGAGGGAALLLFANLASYVAGFVRDIVFAQAFGATGVSDVYFSAFRIPDFLFNFLALGFISGALFPIFSKNEKKDPEKATQIFGNFLTILSLLVGLFSIFAFLAAPFLTPLFYHGDRLSEVVQMTRILLLSPILFTLSNTLGMILLAKKRFFSMAVSPIFYNLGIIVGIVFFAQEWGIFSAAIGAIFGAFLHLATRLFDFPKAGVRIRAVFTLLPETKRIFWLGLPRMMGLAAFQLVLIFFANLATQSGGGGLAAWEFARNIQSMPVSLFGIAFATAVLPFLTDFAQEKNPKKFVARLEKSFGQILFFTIPAAVGIFLIAPILISVLFERGAFDANATATTAMVLMFLSFTIPLESTTHLFARAFLSFENTLFPAMGKILFLVATAFSAKILIGYFGIAALGMAFSLGAFLEIIFLATVLHFRFVSFPLGNFAKTIGKIAFASAIMGMFLFGFLYSSESLPSLFRLVGALLTGAISYFCVAFVSGFSELRELWIFRKKNAKG